MALRYSSSGILVTTSFLTTEMESQTKLAVRSIQQRAVKTIDELTLKSLEEFTSGDKSAVSQMVVNGINKCENTLVDALEALKKSSIEKFMPRIAEKKKRDSESEVMFEKRLEEQKEWRRRCINVLNSLADEWSGTGERFAEVRSNIQKNVKQIHKFTSGFKDHYQQSGPMAIDRARRIRKIMNGLYVALFV